MNHYEWDEDRQRHERELTRMFWQGYQSAIVAGWEA